MTTDLGDEPKVQENTRIMALSLLGTEIWRYFWRTPYDVKPCWKVILTLCAQTRWNFFVILFAVRVDFVGETDLLVRDGSIGSKVGPSAKRPRREVTPDSALIPKIFMEEDSPSKQ
ncbi:hypothetical protein AVEN_232030-1 [Araneus ventricosus]|uniref:Uncharacterized protein n=1 Tax=Araneus ventricosus TaxID=182803 RepID=A0A4Y2UB38_ARAVE|nr:hypothetical protein AVEN_232030-1 [Araneus ventricosus]